MKGVCTCVAWLSLCVVCGIGPRVAGQASVSLTTGEACDGLSEAQCCAQTLKTHAFRASGDQLPRRGGLVVEIACKQSQRKLPATSCRSLLLARGWAIGDAQAACSLKGLSGRCRRDGACRACVTEMGRLGYRATAPACLAATRVAPATTARGAVVLRSGSNDPDAVEVTRRRSRIE